ncbi:M23 family metallopeptidase [Arthrobacter sp. Sa2BUA2]|uniref:M23 family metallopeptidase n=1 Tax=Arthrobacter pullicola TaxID=2762224 RepID=A0ABR8YK91_9MICC|nr:M23 family metallopeptidase [Arthrobacter pullicola]MBD8044644.1 M23 family metallopeptidase [Arthrobacter pullicola]
MTVNVNETVRNLADSVRRYMTDTAARYRADEHTKNTKHTKNKAGNTAEHQTFDAQDRARGKHARPRWDSRGTELVRRMEELRSRAAALGTPARKTAALGAGTSLVLTGMVFGVAEAAPRTLADRQSLDAQPLAASLSQEAPAEAASAEAPAAETPADPAAVDGVGSTAPAAEEGPVAPVDNVYVTSPFGWRINPMTGSGLEWHTGTDFRGATGTNVKATLGGTVTEAGWHTNGGGGLRIVVDHGDGTKSTYNHLNDIWVEPGQWVDGGQVIGSVGSTGNSTGPHLHFEVLINNEYVDPMEWL